ncbi:MAG: family 78 glycoside hydrolase catalytic domain, partial [Desulfobacteraceae bacterium]|nr:family 78 glycoside hydrolase catalytic domain [Desulfobacteraceae bacterium]
VRLKVKGKAGTKVVLRFAEMLHKDGSIMTENLRRARCTDTYIFRGNGKDEIWEPRFTYHGFQYVELTGYPGKPDLGAITGIVLHSAAPVAGSFECSNAMVNKLYSNITWTQRANFFDIPTDCPQRDERLGWTGDAQIYIRSATYNMDVAAFFKKWLVNLEDDQRPSGAFPDFAPLPYLQYEPSPGWMDAGVICPFTIYQVYGDTHVIERHYEAMTKFMDFLLRTGKDYLRSPRGHCWGDWLSIGGRTSNDLIATAYFAYDAKLMAEMAAAIGRMEDAQRYARLFDNIKTAFNKAYVSANGRIKGDTQTCYALALYMDLLPQALKEKAGARLVELIRERNWHLSTGFLGVKYLLPALTEEGYVDVAFRLLTNKTYPSWGYSIENGATTIWERWNSYKKGKGFQDSYMNSFNHYAFGSVCEWMFVFMAGIDTDGAGFKRITIRPQPGGSGITYTKASYDSIYGRIATYWRVRDGKFLLDLTIPANTTATVYIPARDADSITEGGKPASKAEAVQFLRIEDGKAVFAVGSGRYRFISSLPTARQVDETK